MIVIGMPTRGELRAETASDLISLTKYTKRDTMFLPALGSYIPNNRNGLVTAAMQVGASHLLFIDSDMRFPADTIDEFLNTHVGIIAANCRQRTQDAWTARKNGQWVSSAGRSGIERVDSVGTGVMMIDMNVFRGLEPPWFPFEWDAGTGKYVGEDVGFCRKATAAGYQIWIDHTLSQQVRHIGTVELGAQ